MKDFFKKIFEKRGLSEDGINQMYLDFSAVVILTLIGVSKEKLNTTETEQASKMMEDKKIDDLFKMIQSKYSSEEWATMISEHITPICESYIEEVALPVNA